MALIESLLVRLGLQTANFDAGAKRAVKQTQALQSSLGALSRTLTGVGAAFGISFGLQATIDAFQNAITAADEARRESDKLEAVLMATGHAAGFSESALSEYADQLSRLTGIDDQVIMSGEAVLATFKQIQGEVFVGATRAALDMAAVMGGDLQGAIVQVGKALNDPINGLTALTRVGVTFNESQKEQIRVLQESGDLMGAQRVILTELASEFGGAAERMRSPIQALAVDIGNLSESFGELFFSMGGGGALDDLGLAFRTLADITSGKIEWDFGRIDDFIRLANEKRMGEAMGDTFGGAPAADKPMGGAGGLTEAQVQAAEDLQEQIESLNQSLGMERTTMEMTAEEAKIYALELQGATDAQLEFARAVAKSIEARREELAAAQDQRAADQAAFDEMLRFKKEGEEAARREDQEAFDEMLRFKEEGDRIREEDSEVRLAGALEAGSSEAFSAIAKFQASGSGREDTTQLQKEGNRKLDELIRLQREANEANVVVESF